MDHTGDPRLQLVPPGERAAWWLALLVGVLPLLVAVVAVAAQAATHEGMRRADMVALAIALPACTGLWLVLRRSMRRAAVVASAQALEVRSSFYRCRVALHELDLVHSRVVSLDEHPELRPLLKTNGFSLPGFRSGWFRLRNRRRGFVAMADGPRVLWLTGNAHDLLLQVRDPASLLARLRELAAPGAGA